LGRSVRLVLTWAALYANLPSVSTIKTITRQEALQLGLKRYFTGKPCIRGHIDERLTSGCTCIVCHRANWRKAKKANPAKFRKYVNNSKRKRYHADLESSRGRQRLSNWKRAGIVPTRPRPEFCEAQGCKPSGKGVLHADHDKITGKFRGWLCSRCNMGLGSLGDNETGILALLEYIRRAS
jgi:hypothetical protein